MTPWLAYKVVSKVEEPNSNGRHPYFSCATQRHCLEYHSKHKIKPAIEGTGIICFDSLENAINFQLQTRSPNTKKTIFKVLVSNELILPFARFVNPEEFSKEDLKELWEKNRPLPSTSVKSYASWPEGTKAYGAVMLLHEMDVRSLLWAGNNILARM